MKKEQDVDRTQEISAVKHMNTALIVVLAIAVTALFAVLIILWIHSRQTVNPPQPSAMTEADVNENSTTEATGAPATAQATAATNWETAPADRLYRPDSSGFIDQRTVYVCCTDVDVQDYVKMRFGPSATHFNTVGVTIGNFDAVTAESKSVNGWTLCFYNGVEGWIRTDFLFESEAAARAAISAPAAQPGNSADPEAPTPCAGLYRVNVTGEYAGEPLNLRAGPTRESELLAKLEQGAPVRIPENETVQNGWIFVEVIAPTSDDPYNDEAINSGYVLYQYLAPDGVGDKPVLYLYPQKTQDVDVKITLDQNVFFTCTYPAYENGWRVTAKPDGTLTDRATGKEYACLYWELGGRADYSFDEGFVVKGADTAEFLEKTLTEIGLNARERNEFIVYWLPRMQQNPYNLISFQTDAYTSLVDLHISPAPDSLLRVFMAYRPLNAPVQVSPQTFAPFARNGFTAVEWGGAEVLPRR